MFREMISEHYGSVSAGPMVQVKDKRGVYRKYQGTTLRDFCGDQKQNVQEECDADFK